MCRFLLKFLVFSFLMGLAFPQIVIDIDREELQRFGEILVENYFMRDVERGRFSSNSQLRKVLIGVVQLMGITVSLVSASLITNSIQPYALSTPEDEIIPVSTQNNTIKPSDICKFDFGCDENLCWRTCDDGMKSNNSWCYTAAIAGQLQNQLCTHSFQCSPCWDCIGSCFSSRT